MKKFLLVPVSQRAFCSDGVCCGDSRAEDAAVMSEVLRASVDGLIPHEGQCVAALGCLTG